MGARIDRDGLEGDIAVNGGEGGVSFLLRPSRPTQESLPRLPLSLARRFRSGLPGRTSGAGAPHRPRERQNRGEKRG